MLLEGILTTVDMEGGNHVSPMGPVVDAEMQSFVLRPFQTSTTFQNVKRTGQAVFHVTDNVQMLAHAAVGQLKAPAARRADAVDGYILEDACRWYALQIESLDDSRERAEIVARVVDHGRQRDFFGLNRAKHAVVELAILATRIQFLPADDVLRQCEELRGLVDKTGGDDERKAFVFLESFIVITSSINLVSRSHS